eukprot:870365-Rhodomonas_salina.3
MGGAGARRLAATARRAMARTGKGRAPSHKSPSFQGPLAALAKFSPTFTSAKFSRLSIQHSLVNFRQPAARDLPSSIERRLHPHTRSRAQQSITRAHSQGVTCPAEVCPLGLRHHLSRELAQYDRGAAKCFSDVWWLEGGLEGGREGGRESKTGSQKEGERTSGTRGGWEYSLLRRPAGRVF